MYWGGVGREESCSVTLFSLYKLQSRGVGRNSYTEVGARVEICDHIVCEACHLASCVYNSRGFI